MESAVKADSRHDCLLVADKKACTTLSCHVIPRLQVDIQRMTAQSKPEQYHLRIPVRVP